MRKLRVEILETLRYFSNFAYAPTFQEIHTFLELKISKKKLLEQLEKMAQDGAVSKNSLKIAKSPDDSTNRYTLGGYSRSFKKLEFSIQNSKFKFEKIDRYIKLISKFSQIKLIGLSGSLAMMNASRDDDIDLFIITARNRLWTARFIANVSALLYGLKRKKRVEKAADKVCLNLLFDEKSMRVPRFKQNKYVAHEVLQMRPLMSRGDIYSRYLDANKWVFDIFPNDSRSRPNFVYSVGTLRSSWSRNPKSQKNWSLRFSNFLEVFLKRIQLFFINRHKTTEIITDTQLWFFPEDFERKIVL